MQTTFGTELKDWRTRRRLSQLDLGLQANVSARHISFLETGRARPSRPMVIQLCESLEVPRNARNTLLSAAGFAPAYRRRELGEDEMAHVRAAVDWTLERHAPFPAFALDKHWTILRANPPAALLLAAANLHEGDCLLDVMSNTELMDEILENAEEVMRHMAIRLRTESAHLGGDPILDEAAERLAKAVGEHAPALEVPLPPVIPARYKAGGGVLSFFSTLAQFGSAEDIALAELKIEMMFPADEATRETLLAMASNAEEAARS